MMLDTVFEPEQLQHMQDLRNALLNGPLAKQLVFEPEQLQHTRT